MKLSVEVKADFDNSISIIDYTRDLGEYIPEETEDILLSYYTFKYSLTCTIDVAKYISTTEEKIVGIGFFPHDLELDSMRLPIGQDGYYTLSHIVLPTVQWLDKFKNEDLSEYNIIYVTDGCRVYKYLNGELLEVSIEEIISVNPFKTTISIEDFKIFNISSLKMCYTKLLRQILNNYCGKCLKIDNTLAFNRDFLRMTLAVIHIYLEMGMYSEAQVVLEDLNCHNFCADVNPKKTNSCGCSRKSK